MSITWVICADTTMAKIYALGHIKGQLTLIKELDNPEGRWKAGDIGFDKPGQFENPMHGQSKTFERADPKQVELHQFAHKIAQNVEHGRVNHAFERLVFVMDPHFYGILSQELKPLDEKLVHKTVQKNYMHLTDKELYTHLIELE